MTTSSSHHSLDPNPSRLKRLLVVVRSNLIAGLLVAGPIYITIWILNWLYEKIDPPVQQFVLWLMRVNVDGLDLDGKVIALPGLHRVHDWPIFPEGLPTFLNLNYINTFQGPTYKVIFGLGLVVTFLILLFTGFLTRTFIGRLMLDLLDGALNRIPVVNTIYSSLRQLTETMFGKSAEGQKQKEVVLVEYPGPGSAAVGFVTGVTRGAMQTGAVRFFNGTHPAANSGNSPALNPAVTPAAPASPPSAPAPATNEEMLLVFLPMAPLPTGGFLILVPRSKVTKLDITVEQAFQMIVSGGIIQPNGAPTGPTIPANNIAKPIPD